MHAANATHVTAKCRNCGKLNEMTVCDVPARQEISCSRCHAPMGTWHDLSLAGAEPPATPAAV